MNIEQNTKHAARATQVERQVEKKAEEWFLLNLWALPGGYLNLWALSGRLSPDKPPVS